MLKKTLSFENIDGITVTRDFYFNYNKLEIVEKQAAFEEARLVIQSLNERWKQDDVTDSERVNLVRRFITMFEELMLPAYGIRTADGDFIKSPEETAKFKASSMYGDWLYNMATEHPEEIGEFLTALVPKDIRARADELTARERSEAAMQGYKPSAREIAAQEAAKKAAENHVPVVTENSPFQEPVISTPDVARSNYTPPNPDEVQLPSDYKDFLAWKESNQQGSGA